MYKPCYTLLHLSFITLFSYWTFGKCATNNYFWHGEWIFQNSIVDDKRALRLRVCFLTRHNIEQILRFVIKIINFKIRYSNRHNFSLRSSVITDENNLGIRKVGFFLNINDEILLKQISNWFWKCTYTCIAK